MQEHEVRSVFAHVYNGRANFLTPARVAFGKKGKLIWELSRGKGLFPGTELYGVTVIELPNIKRPDLSTAFSSAEDAYTYIKGGFTND